MRTLLLMTSLAILVIQYPTSARAQLLGLGATEATQILNHAELVSQYIRAGEQLAEAVKQTADMVRNTKGRTSEAFGKVADDLAQIAHIIQQGRALAYSLENIDAIFQERFPGYGYKAKGYYAGYRDWSQTSLDTTRSTLRAIGLQNEQLQSEQSVVSALLTLSRTADGRMEALQVANQVAEQQVEQLMKLRALILADLQSKQAFQAMQVQKESSTTAATEQFFRYSRQSSSGNTFQGGWK